MVAYPAPKRLRQEDSCKHELSLGYIAQASLGYRTRACQRGCGGSSFMVYSLYIYIYKPYHIYKPETCPPLGEGIQ